MATKRWSAVQVLDAIKKHRMEIAHDDDGWYAYIPAGFHSEEYDSLEDAVRDAALEAEAAAKEEADAQERRDQEEFVRLSKKYGTSV